jgi:hypothetical protein
MAEIKEQMLEHLKKGEDWEEMEIEGFESVSVVKVPATKTRDALLNIQINPIKEGKRIKRKGLFVSSKEMLVMFSEALNDDKTYQLAGLIDEINPDQAKPKKKLSMD